MMIRNDVARLLLAFFFLCAGQGAMAQDAAAQAVDSTCRKVMFQTTMGNIEVALYNDTPLHRDNFLKNVASGYYDGVLFHRVIERFMIQAGDTASRHAQPGALLGDTPESYTVPAEIRFPLHFHKRGALAAAREGDDVNPQMASSQGQFYIVWGARYGDNGLNAAQQKLDEHTGGRVQLTPEVRQCYKTQGGTPHLDGQYTVFGEVVQGLDVVDSIQQVATDGNDRPLQDVRIIKATVVR